MPASRMTTRAGSAVALPIQQAITGLPLTSPPLAIPATASAAAIGDDSAVGQFIARMASTSGSAAIAAMAAT